MRKQILKSILAIGIIAFAVSITAVSCGKTAGGGNNNSGGGNSGGGDGGSGGCTGICPTTNLTLSASKNYVKVSDNTVTINAAGLAGDIIPYSDADPANRGFYDIEAAAGGNIKSLFDIAYPGAINGTSAGLYFVNRAHVTKDTITMPAATTTCPSHETDEALLAASAAGGMCRFHNNPGGDRFVFVSYLGAVFNNTDTANHARGTIVCATDLAKTSSSGGPREVVSDTTIFNGDFRVLCQIAMVNSGLGTGVEIDDAWVGDSDSTTEVEFYAIGIDVTGKTIPKWSDASGYNLAEFRKAHDNAAFKKLLQNNPWGELRFKVKIVKSTDF